MPGWLHFSCISTPVKSVTNGSYAVQGPGAGAAVTAAGIYADFLKIAAPHASATWLSPLAPARRLALESVREVAP